MDRSHVKLVGNRSEWNRWRWWDWHDGTCLIFPAVDVSFALRALWPAFAVAMLPAAVFLYATPDLMQVRIARILQSLAVVWYFPVAIFVLSLAAYRGVWEQEVFFVFPILIGAWPCAVAAYKLRRGSAS